jgi:hypothetical protein
MADGIGCKCSARDISECGCDADWTPQEVYDLRARIAELEGAYGALAVEHERLKDKLKAPPSEWEIEIAAKSLAQCYFLDHEHELSGKLEDYVKERWQLFIGDAKAAIEAFMEGRR